MASIAFMPINSHCHIMQIYICEKRILSFRGGLSRIWYLSSPPRPVHLRGYYLKGKTSIQKERSMDDDKDG